MPENTKKLPPWARKILLITGVVGPLCGALTTIYVTVSDIRSKARDAKTQATTGYETLAPAVQELQLIVEDMQEWLDEDDKNIQELLETVRQQERQILRLEAWIETIGSRQNAPEPVPQTMELPPPESSDKPKTHSPKWKIPDSASGAKALQQQRVKLRCSPEDPLCGGLE